MSNRKLAPIVFVKKNTLRPCIHIYFILLAAYFQLQKCHHFLLVISELFRLLTYQFFIMAGTSNTACNAGFGLSSLFHNKG